MTTLSLFYVEDDEIDIVSWRKFLKQFDNDITLDSATSVAKGIAGFDHKKYDAALIDWTLGDGDGVEIAQHIRQLDPKFPIVFLSGIITDDQIKKAQQYKPLGCIQKGFCTAYMESVLLILRNDNEAI